MAMAEAISQRTDYHDIKTWVFRAFVWCLVLVKTASLVLWRICRKISSISFISPALSPEYFCFSDVKDCLFLHYTFFPSPTVNPRQSVPYNFHILRCFRGVLELVITVRGYYYARSCVCSLVIVIPTIPRRVIVYNVSFPSMKFNHIWKYNWQVDGVCKWFVFTHDGDLLHKINHFE